MLKLPIDFPPGTPYAAAFNDLLLILKQGGRSYRSTLANRSTSSRRERFRKIPDPDAKTRRERKTIARAYALDRYLNQRG